MDRSTKISQNDKNANINPDTVVYMDYGTEELPRYKHMIQKICDDIFNVDEKKILD